MTEFLDLKSGILFSGSVFTETLLFFLAGTVNLVKYDADSGAVDGEHGKLSGTGASALVGFW